MLKSILEKFYFEGHMKKIIILYCSFAVLLILTVSYFGCSVIDKNALTPVAPISGAHPSGWGDTNNVDGPNFHAKYFSQINWNLSVCKTCHGADYKGGSTGVSCLKCHTAQNGPEACNNCHGDRPGTDQFNPGHPYPPTSLNGDSLETDRGVGTHNHHLTSDPNERYSAQVRCGDCHSQVNNFSDASHIQNTTGHATLHFDSLALNVLSGDTTHPHPSYDPVANKCSNVYCHGYFTGGNMNFEPTYNDPNSVTCGSCHGDPVSGNPNPSQNPPHLPYYQITDCYECHGQVIDASGNIIDPTKHIDGVVEVYGSSKPRKK